MFVATIMSHYLTGKSATEISSNGHCHNLGNGTWNNTEDVFLIGDQWQDRVYHKPILFSHYTNLARVRELMPNIRVVLIAYNKDDVELITRFRTIKAHHLNWTLEEYQKFAGPDWPDYHPDNILNNQLVQNELTELGSPYTQDWIAQVDCNLVDYVLQFKDIVGGDVNQAIADIFGRAKDPSIDQFIQQYQTVNQQTHG